MSKSGIYQIKNTENSKVYIGSAVDIKKRWSTHLSLLRLNKHYNKYLQHSWIKYGEESFEFSILEYTHKSELLKVEQNYLDNVKPYNPEIGYNLLSKAGSRLGTPLTEQHKKNISKSLSGENHYMFGKQQSKEFVEKRFANRSKDSMRTSSKLTKENVVAIKKLLKEGKLRQKDIATMYNVSKTTISEIKHEKVWSDIK